MLNFNNYCQKMVMDMIHVQRQSESSCKDVIIEGIRISWGVGETVNAPLILPTYTSDNNELVIVTTETETDRDKTSQAQPMSKHIHPHKLRNVLLLAAEVSKRRGPWWVGGTGWRLAAKDERQGLIIILVAVCCV